MNQTTINSIIANFILGILRFCSAAPSSFAQIVPDNTIPTQVKTNVNINNVPSVVIDGGSIKGSNLFHSFSEFNIDAGQSVYFTNPNNINNILTRVTGANISNINGTLGVLGNANLFFLNPNGITFGANGGNITIDAQLLIQLENSDIIAQAFNGRGGNIQINAQGLLGGQFRSNLTPQSDITASSQFGVNGVVNLNVPQVDITQGINTFTLSFINNNTQLTSTCSAVNANKFTISGRGGLPASPVQPLLGETIWQDFRFDDNIVSYPQKTRASKVNNNLDLVEATG